MNCIGCDNSGYRKLCYYDNEHNTCTPNNMGKSSFKCVGMGYGASSGDKQCVQTNLPPGDDRYSTMSECQSSCSGTGHPGPPLGQTSYQCVGTGYGGSGKQCVRTNLPPGDDRYSTMSECQSSCSGTGPPLGQTSYQCVGTGYGGSGKQCVRTNLPPGNGRFTNMSECQSSCSGTGPPGPKSFLSRFDGIN